MPELPRFRIHGLHAAIVARAAAHSTYLVSGDKTCIDCHKGIAHQLPDMKGVPGWDVTFTAPTSD